MGKGIRDNGKSGTQVSELSFASGADPQPPTPALRPSDARRRTLDSRRQAANAGFTLLEVMVALVVLALGIAAVLELFGGGLRLTTKSSRRTQAVVYAQNVMDHLLAQSTLEDGDDGGQFPGGFSWRAQVYEIRPDDDASPLQQKSQNQSEFFRLKQLNVEVYWSEGVGEQSYALRSLRTITDQPQPQAQQQ
jgi:general secretion pathway protein I